MLVEAQANIFSVFLQASTFLFLYRACRHGINYSNTDPKTLLALMRSEHAPSELVRLVEIMKNRRGLPNYFMEKMTPGHRKKYSDSHVVFMHHHKAGGTSTKAILERIHQNFNIPSVLIHIMNSEAKFALIL